MSNYKNPEGIYRDDSDKAVKDIQNYHRDYKVQAGANGAPEAISKGFTSVEKPAHPAAFNSSDMPMGAGKPFVPKRRR